LEEKEEEREKRKRKKNGKGKLEELKEKNWHGPFET
jgi:hypothetical protein